MLQRSAATGSARNKSARHVTTADGATISSNSTFKSIWPQKTSAASNARPSAVLARPVHQRLRAAALESACSMAGALDSIRAGSYRWRNADRAGYSLDSLIYIKNPCRINGAPMRTILITGGAGVIRANLVNYLTEKYPEKPSIVLEILT